MKLVHVALVAVAGLAIAAFAGVLQPSGAQGQAAEPAAGAITANGTGSVTVTPDRASFTFGTISQGRTASAALTASSQAIDRVVAALRNAGVATADIQTSEVSLSPRMNETGDTITGYTATNSVTARIRQLDNAGRVIDAAVGAGANQVYGPNLLVSDTDAAYRNALRAAVTEAREKAQVLATASGLTLGRIVAMTESGSTPPPMPLTGGARDSAPQIEPGTQRIEATVSVSFAIG
jgi:uncharacterized protein